MQEIAWKPWRCRVRKTPCPTSSCFIINITLRTWAEILRELKVRFGDRAGSQYGLQVLRTSKQQAGETVQIYAERLLGLAELAWPEESLLTPLIQRQVLDILWMGCKNNLIPRKVFCEVPSTVAQTVKIALDKQKLTKKLNLRNRVCQASRSI